MNFDLQELNRRPYQVLSTLYHLSRFFLQNAEFDKFTPQKYSLEWAKNTNQLRKPDLWLLSKLHEKIEDYTLKLEKCEFNTALAILEDFVIEAMSRLYVPMIRKELWTDDPETHDRRQAIYATLHYALKTVTLLFNPVTPYLSEELYQKVYRKLDQTLPESVNFEDWPKPEAEMRNRTLEEEFQTLFRCVSLTYSARQSAKLKRRWPLNRIVVVAPEKVCSALKNVEELFLELANVKTAEYAQQAPENVLKQNWVSASEDDTQVFLNTERDERLLGEGLMRDLARRVQALRKELGYMPTDVLDVVHIAELEEESIRLLEPYVESMAELVRARRVQLHPHCKGSKNEWHEFQLDDKKVYVTIS